MYCSASYTAGVDFTPISQIIYFPSGCGPRNRTCVSIPIIDDSLEEESEFFNLHLFVCALNRDIDSKVCLYAS